jgi:hypothetical protein
MKVEQWMENAAKEILLKDSFSLKDDAKIIAKHYSANSVSGVEDKAATTPTIPTTRDWVRCPICGELDMRQETDADGQAIISCVNLVCASNGGSNASGLSLQRELDSAHRLWEKEHDELVVLREKVRRYSGAPSLVEGQAAPTCPGGDICDGDLPGEWHEKECPCYREEVDGVAAKEWVDRAPEVQAEFDAWKARRESKLSGVEGLVTALQAAHNSAKLALGCGIGVSLETLAHIRDEAERALMEYQKSK